MERRINFQTIAWFIDINKRNMLNLNPPFQRRSVWPLSFKEYFIDTILLNYPSPTIFLYEEIKPDGTVNYYVVDGKQRLETIFEFLNGTICVGQDATMINLRGRLFEDLDNSEKARFLNYTFSVEYMVTRDEATIKNIFDRLNRNVVKLTPQELRHAKFSGEFISACEELAEWLYLEFPKNFPQIPSQNRSQMKDVEFVANVLLRLEGEPKGYETGELDIAFSQREDEWPKKTDVVIRFRKLTQLILGYIRISKNGEFEKSRFRNLNDLYSLFGALAYIEENSKLPSQKIVYPRLMAFSQYQDSEKFEPKIEIYLNYVKSSSNKTQARKERESILVKIILGDLEV